MRTFLLFAALLAAPHALGAPNPKLEEARKLTEDLDLEKAAKALAAAEATPGNDRAQVMEILELQGIVYGTLNKQAKARDAFRELLTLNPDYKLAGDHPPRVRTPFFEAREWVAENGPVSITPAPVVEGGKVSAVTLTVKKDGLRLVRRARFVLQTDAGEQTINTQLDTAGVAKVPVNAPSVKWWAVLLSERDGVLFEVGAANAPLTHSASVAVDGGGSETPVVVQTASPRAWMRVPGYALLGGAAVAGGVGVALGVMANGARARVQSAATNENGLVTGLTQREATALEASARTQATIANVLFATGGALAAAGVSFVVLGNTGSGPAVTIAPAPGGVLATGSF